MQVVLDADLAGQVNLRFQKVDVLFGVVQDVLQQIARNVIAHAFAMSNAVFHGDLRGRFKLQIAIECFQHVLANHQLAQVLQIGQGVEHEQPVHQPVGVLHLANGFLVLLLGQPVQAPVLVHAVVNKVLVDGRQLVFQLRLQVRDDLCVAFHEGLLVSFWKPLLSATPAHWASQPAKP